MMKLFKLVTLTLAMLLLCGCQSREGPQAATQPGPTFGEPMVFETLPEGETIPASQQIQLNDAFLSADGTVAFSIHIDQQLATEDLRILEARLRPITGADAQRLAEIVFPGCTFYDQEPQSSQVYSKEEVQRNIDLFTQYEDYDLLVELFGESARDQSFHVANNREFWKKQLKKAKEENPHEICQWEFKPDSYYYDLDGRDPNNHWNEIYAVTRKENVEYLLYALHSTDPDRQYQKLGIGIDGNMLTRPLGWHTLVHGDAPTEAHVEGAKVRAQEILDQLDVGHWQVVEAQVVQAGLTDGAYIAVEAGLLLDDVVIPDQWDAVDGYVTSHAYVALNTDGEVVDFDLWVPMELQGTVTDRPKMLPLEDIIAQAKEQLTQYTAWEEFGRLPMPLGMTQAQAMTCQVDISQVEYTMARKKAPDDAETFYYYPVLTFLGTAQYYGDESGSLLTGSEERTPLFAVSTLDGTVTIF